MKIDEFKEVIVVGAGFSGLPAYIAAANEIAANGYLELIATEAHQKELESV